MITLILSQQSLSNIFKCGSKIRATTEKKQFINVRKSTYDTFYTDLYSWSWHQSNILFSYYRDRKSKSNLIIKSSKFCPLKYVTLWLLLMSLYNFQILLLVQNLQSDMVLISAEKRKILYSKESQKFWQVFLHF